MLMAGVVMADLSCPFAIEPTHDDSHCQDKAHYNALINTNHTFMLIFMRFID